MSKDTDPTEDPIELARRYGQNPKNEDHFCTAILILSRAESKQALDKLLLLFLLDSKYNRADIAAAQFIVERELGFVPGRRAKQVIH